MNSSVMPHDLFTRYQADPLKTDEEVRKTCRVPDNRYYTVAVWPDPLAGTVTVLTNMTRTVAPNKVSKSNQP